MTKSISNCTLVHTHPRRASPEALPFPRHAGLRISSRKQAEQQQRLGSWHGVSAQRQQAQAFSQVQQLLLRIFPHPCSAFAFVGSVLAQEAVRFDGEEDDGTQCQDKG